MNHQRKISAPAKRKGIISDSYKKFPFYFLIPIFCLLLLGAVKSDTQGLLPSDVWAGLNISQVNATIKNNIQYMYAVLLASMIYCLARIGLGRIFFTAPVALLILMYSLFLIRIGFSDGDLLIRMSALFLTIISFFVFICSLYSMKFDAVYIVRCSLFFVSVVIVAINGYELLAGGGYASGARFFGVAGHPNFLGVQMAFCCLVGAAHQGQKLLISKLARYAVIAISIYILYKSGSRTGIIVLFVGYAAYYTINNPAKNTLIFASILSFATLMIVASGFMDSLFTEGVYARNDVNTRAGVWQDLWDIVKQAPLIGHGYLPDSTANSWLRGWATVGVIYPIFLLLIISSFLKQIVKAWGTPYLKHASMLIGIFFAITTGSILEGYLFDANSLPIHAWFISLITSSIYLSLMNGRSSFVGQIKRPAEKFDRRMAASSQEIALKAQQ